MKPIQKYKAILNKQLNAKTDQETDSATEQISELLKKNPELKNPYTSYSLMVE